MSKDRRDSKKNKTLEPKPNVMCNECDEPCSQDDKHIINCDICKKWYHKGCTNIKNSEWKFMVSNPNILFSCDTCLQKKGNDASDIREIKELLQDNI